MITIKNQFIALIILTILLSFGLGYTVWKITGVPNLAPIESEAAKAFINGEWVRVGWTCFPGDTQITMSSYKSKDIKNIVVGDYVITQSENNIRSTSMVKAIEAPIREHLCEIEFDNNEILNLTAEHPLFTSEGWKSISPDLTYRENKDLITTKLAVGDKLIRLDSTFSSVKSIKCWKEDIQTYNLILDDGYHTFFANEFLAHNKRNTIFTPGDDGKIHFDDDGHFTGEEVYVDEAEGSMEISCAVNNSIPCNTSPNCAGFCLNPAWTGGGCIKAYQAKGCELNSRYDSQKISKSHGCPPQGGATASFYCAPGANITGPKGCADSTNIPNGVQIHYNSNGTCEITGQFCGTIQIDGSNGEFVSRTHICTEPEKEQFTDYNPCDGGDILEQTQPLHIGEPITVTGWAYDETGIDTSAIAVSVDGTFVGNATAVAGCPTQTSTCNSTHKNPITWSYTFTATANEHSVSVKWKDIKGVESAACTAAQALSRINVCEGGGIVPQTSSIEIGDNVTVTGWAYDEDGININKIPVSVDGTFAGDRRNYSNWMPDSSFKL